MSALGSAPIGVFDSGVGGLTVLAALQAQLPAQRFIYLGDTARLPYGTKSGDTIIRYALQAAALLVERGIGALVVACNTASSVALPALRDRFPQLPVIGVVEPGAAAACAASVSGRIGVIATEGTVRGGAYQRAILALRPDAEVSAAACQVLVALAEEGWHDNDVALAAVRRYLEPLLAQSRCDTLVLGCTHFPLLAPVIAQVCGPQVRIVDSARTTALAVAAVVKANNAAAGGVTGGAVADQAPPSAPLFLATDGVERFARVGARFLAAPITASQIELVDL